MKRRPALAVAACVCSALFAPAVAAFGQPLTLRYSWTQGNTLTYRTVLRTSSAVTGGPNGGGTSEHTLSETVKITVAAVGADGTATLRQVIDTMSLEIAGPAGKLVYDSSKPPGADADPRVVAMAKTMGGMIGEAISVTMAPDGAVRRIDGTQRVIDKLMADLPRDPMAGGLAQTIRNMLSEDALRASLEQSFPRMPDAPVNPGSTWTAEQAVGTDAVGKIVSTSTFTLKSVDGSGDQALAHIAVSLALKQQDVPSAGASVVMKLGASKGEGEVIFNVAKGRVERNTMRTDMSSSAAVRGPEGPVTLQNTTRTQMSMELVK